MFKFSRLAAAALLAPLLGIAPLSPANAQGASLTISTGFGPTAEVPDPRAGYR